MRILATAAFAFAAGVFSTQILPEGGWLPLGLAALAAAVLCALLRWSAARPERKRRRVLLRRPSFLAERRWVCCTRRAIARWLWPPSRGPGRADGAL